MLFVFFCLFCNHSLEQVADSCYRSLEQLDPALLETLCGKVSIIIIVIIIVVIIIVITIIKAILSRAFAELRCFSLSLDAGYC